MLTIESVVLHPARCPNEMKRNTAYKRIPNKKTPSICMCKLLASMPAADTYCGMPLQDSHLCPAVPSHYPAHVLACRNPRRKPTCLVQNLVHSDMVLVNVRTVTVVPASHVLLLPWPSVPARVPGTQRALLALYHARTATLLARTAAAPAAAAPSQLPPLPLAAMQSMRGQTIRGTRCCFSSTFKLAVTYEFGHHRANAAVGTVLFELHRAVAIWHPPHMSGERPRRCEACT